MFLSENLKKYLSPIGAMFIMAALCTPTIGSSCVPYVFSYIRLFDNEDVRYSETLWVSSFYIVAVSLSATLNGILINRFKLSFKIVGIFGTLLLR